MDLVVYAFLGCQLFFVLFIALHDWGPSGKQGTATVSPACPASRISRKLILAKAAGALPYFVDLLATGYYVGTGFPIWLLWLLWVSYGSAVYGMLRAWWIPYLASERRGDSSRRSTIISIHDYLSTGEGITLRPLSLSLNAVAAVALVLLGVLTFSVRPFVIR